ncbi:hypothetical protein FSP39_012019 [Pinctada imbricata]|uniref:Wiskott-Aldrich syndrome protein family member n=1 Tax=Pinctada imbricata TaxID=66713 RepID=A0AA88Y4U9_PINIB|nr:hypothetical protein FSP39_012019 [Pinctada imbricata]
MPFIQRIVEPINVSRGEVPKGIKNELECVTDHALGNVIAQLSSLSKQAEDMFLELSQECAAFRFPCQTATKKNHTTPREVSLQDIHQRKPYKGSIQHDQQVVSRSTVSRSILDMHGKCDPTPALDKLIRTGNVSVVPPGALVFREDGKDCMKFYTDPNYFFELWYLEIQKEMEQKKMEVRERRRRKRPPKSDGEQRKKPKQVLTRAEKYEHLKQGQELSNDYKDPRELMKISGTTYGSQSHQNHVQGGQQVRPESLSVQHQQQQHIQDNSYNDASVERRPSKHKKQANGPHISHGPDNYPHLSQNIDRNGPVPQNQIHQYQQHNYNQHQLSPGQNRDSRGSRGSLMSPNRPSQPPPAPPPIMGDHMRQSPARDSLPPPPPPPPLEEGYNKSYTPSPHGTPIQNRQTQIRSTTRGSPVRQDPGMRGTPEMDNLPPPPPPPPLSPDIPDPVPPPPPPLNDGMAPPPPPPPPPPQMAPVINGIDSMSIGSTGSSETSSSVTMPASKQSNLPAITSDRSDLLAEIRMGTMMGKLRKVDEKEREQRKSRGEHGNFDVHSIMTRAFDMRRKAVEDSDSESDLEDGEEWDD